MKNWKKCSFKFVRSSLGNFGNMMEEKRFFWESRLFFRILSIKNFYLGERFILLDTNELQKQIIKSSWREKERNYLYIFLEMEERKDSFLKLLCW